MNFKTLIVIAGTGLVGAAAYAHSPAGVTSIASSSGPDYDKLELTYDQDRNTVRIINVDERAHALNRVVVNGRYDNDECSFSSHVDWSTGHANPVDDVADLHVGEKTEIYGPECGSRVIMIDVYMDGDKTGHRFHFK
jgi:hypothetical protein